MRTTTTRATEPKALGIAPEKLTPLLAANPVWIEKLLAHLKQKYGSVEGFLKQKAGMDEATLQQLRANLLEKW